MWLTFSFHQTVLGNQIMITVVQLIDNIMVKCDSINYSCMNLSPFA